MTLRRSDIGWCDYSGADLNFLIGCTNISEGCANCYGFRWAKRAGRDFREVKTYPQKLGRLWRTKWSPDGKPYRRGPGSKPVMFPMDLGDLFHEEVEEDFILAALDMMLCRNDADWVVLTKRAERMYSVVTDWLEVNELERMPAHIWPMVTAENQAWADKRVPWLLRIPAEVHGLSIEPMLEFINIFEWLGRHPISRSIAHFQRTGHQGFGGTVDRTECPCGATWIRETPRLSWIIIGAESGPNRRLFEMAWAENVYEQCLASGVAFFGKQDSGLYPGIPLILPKYGEVKEWPR